MTTGATKSKANRLLQDGLAGAIFLLVFVCVAIYVVNNTQPKPIMVESAGLSDLEIAAVQSVTQPMGEIHFFAADLTTIHQKVAELSWVEQAYVYRDWRKGIVVSAVPRKAIANFGSEHMLDANGVVFQPADQKMLMDKKLVQLYGRHTEAPKIMKQMHQINSWFAPLGLSAKDVVLTPRHTWVIIFNTGMRVVVDHENTSQKLYSLSLQLNGALAKEMAKIQSVDLRYKNGFAISHRAEAKADADVVN